MTSRRYSPPGRTSSDAVMPIQRVAFAGSTRNSHTVSGLASIAISRSTRVLSVVASTLRPLLSFRFSLECLEAVAPELLEEGTQLRQALGSRAVEPLRPVSSLAHEPRLLQDVQVL